MVEHNTFNVGVEGSSPSGITKTNGSLAQWLEQWTHNPKVTGSSPVRSTITKQLKTNNFIMAHCETIIRFCKYTGQLVLAEIVVQSTHDIICLHNDNESDDRQDVIKWLKEHGLETLE